MSRARVPFLFQFHCRAVAITCALLLSALPHTVSSADNAAGDRSEARRNIVVLGDSLAAGHGLEPEESFPALLQKKVDAAGWHFKVVNAGLSGDTSAGGLRRIDWLLRQRIDVLLLELGGNDGLRGIAPSTTRTNLQSIIDRTRKKYPDAKVIIAGMKMPPNMGEEYRNQFERVFVEVAESKQALLIPFLLEGVGGRPELNQPDRIHPTAEGQRVVAENVWRVLRPLLETMQTRAAGKF